MMPLPGPDAGGKSSERETSDEPHSVVSLEQSLCVLPHCAAVASLTNFEASFVAAAADPTGRVRRDQIRVQRVHEQIAVLARLIHVLEGGGGEMIEIGIAGLPRFCSCG